MSKQGFGTSAHKEFIKRSTLETFYFNALAVISKTIIFNNLFFEF